MENEHKSNPENLQLEADLEGHYPLSGDHKASKTVGIFYAPSGGNVHKIARMVKQKLTDYYPEMYSIADITPIKLLDYQNLILVCSTLGRNTWEMEQRDPWSSFLPKMRRLRFGDRKVGVIGLGDHVSYPNNFVDGMGILADVVTESGGRLIGKTETRDYVFNDSRALEDGKFVGLPLDDDYESERTEKRIDDWVKRIKREL